MIAAEQVVALYDELVKERGPDFARMRKVARVIDGDFAVPLPELGTNEEPLVANLAKNGMDQLSQRLASVLPEVVFPPKTASKAAQSKARLQTRVGHWFLQENEMPLMLRQRARYLLAYAAAPVRIDFDTERGVPSWDCPTPLKVVAPSPASPLDMSPPFAISATVYSAAKLRKMFGSHVVAMSALGKSKPADEWEVLSYADDTDFALVLAGKVEGDGYGAAPKRLAVMLTAVPNRMGACPWVYPGLFHLRKPQGHFDGMLGMYQASAQLSALQSIAAYKGVMQETWLVGRHGETPDILAEANALTGEVGIVQGGVLQSIAPDAQWQTNTHLDRLFEQQRINGGIPSDFQGLASSNVRTGRRASQLVSATTDYALQEGQEIVAASLEREMVLATKMDRAYLNKGKTISLYLRGDFSEYKYKPSELWDDYCRARVSYAMPGMDASSVAITSAGKVGAGMMSRRRGMELDPTIQDVEAEDRKIESERLRDAFLESILVQASTPEGPYGPEQMARLIEMVQFEGKPMYEAVITLAKEERERQATPVEAGAPEAQPGLVPLAEEPPPAIAGPNPGQSNLASLMSNLRRPAMAIQTPGGGRA
jgi:hypothetical protein